MPITFLVSLFTSVSLLRCLNPLKVNMGEDGSRQYVFYVYETATEQINFKISLSRQKRCLTLPRAHANVFPSQQVSCRFLTSMVNLAISEKLALGCFLVSRINSL